MAVKYDLTTMCGRAVDDESEHGPPRAGSRRRQSLAIRSQRHLGIGWYYVGASTEFGVIPRAVFDPHNGTGVEAFYNIQVMPWLTVNPDVQYIQPGMRRIATHDAYIAGFRVNVIL